MAEVRDLPGHPSLTRVRAVKRILKTYLCSQPKPEHRCWRLAWEWAVHEAEQSVVYRSGISRRKQWPPAREIASRYVLLCLVEMKAACQLNVGLIDKSKVPFSVTQFLSEESMLIGQVRTDFGIDLIDTDRPCVGLPGTAT